MTEFQSDLVGYADKDVSDYTSDLTASLREAADEAHSELDFGQRIRGSLDDVMAEFEGIEFDFVDTEIGTLSVSDVNAALEAQELTFDDIPFDRSDIDGGGQRPDAVVGAAVVDYKDPGKLASSSGRKDALGQLGGYMVTVAEEQNVDVSDTVGVLTDGEQYLFLHGDDFSQVERRYVNEGATEEFVHLLVGHWAGLTTDGMIGDFGVRTEISINAVNAFYEAFDDAGERSEKFFEEWRLLFEQVCGFEFNKGADVLEEYYGLNISNEEEFRQALFALYTYYALIAKLLAAEFVHYHQDSRFLSFSKKLIGRSNEELRKQMKQFEEGWVFNDAGIDNFLEVSLFSWYIESSVWNDELTDAIVDIAERMRKYDPGRVREEPQEARDLFKNLYQHLVPGELRNQLGEVFTPDWLAELTIEKSGYDGEGTVLDPTCGSGTFLVFAARKKKEWYQEQYGDDLSEEQKEELAHKLLNEIEGFDLNPLAVLASRTNLLIEMGDLLGYYTDNVPVYLADSLRPPELSGQLTGSFYTVEEIPEGNSGDDGGEDEEGRMEIKVPKEIIDRDLVNKYFDLAKKHTLREIDADGFIEDFEQELGIEVPQTKSAIRSSYDDVADLHDRDVNGVWWGIVKNQFRPRFCGEFDYLLGNPPWITLDELTENYRDKVRAEWRTHDILPDDGHAQKKVEHGLLFTVVSLKNYLSDSGDLSFLLPLTAQRGGGATKFRRFLHQETKAKEITDVADPDPFDVTRNRPLVLTVENGSQTEFPIPCDTWIGDTPDFDARLDEVDIDVHPFVAGPLNGAEGKWYSAPQEALDAFKTLYGDSDYHAHEGINTRGGNRLFFVDIVDERTGLVRNRSEKQGKDWGEIRHQVDTSHLFPAAIGEDVNRWGCSSSEVMTVPYDENGRAYSDSELRRTETWDFLHHDDLKMDVGDRKLYGTRMTDTDHPDHFLMGVTEEVFADYKAVYPDISGGTYVDFRAATLGPETLLGDEKPTVFVHKVMYVGAESKEEGYYLSGIMNAAPVRAMVRAHSVLSTNPRAVEEVDIPTFDEGNEIHVELAELSDAAHQLTDSGEIEDGLTESISDLFSNSSEDLDIQTIEEKIDERVSVMFDITDDELSSVRDYLEITQS